MSTIKISTTAYTPSFGMPIFGSASVAAACPGTGVAIRDRQHGGFVVASAAVKGSAAAVEATLPGTTAWRPPTC